MHAGRRAVSIECAISRATWRRCRSRADLVTASALLDLVSRHLAGPTGELLSGGAAVLLTLSVGRRQVWDPADREDDLVRRLFSAHQGDKGFGPASGLAPPLPAVRTFWPRATRAHARSDWGSCARRSRGPGASAQPHRRIGGRGHRAVHGRGRRARDWQARRHGWQRASRCALTCRPQWRRPSDEVSVYFEGPDRGPTKRSSPSAHLRRWPQQSSMVACGATAGRAGPTPISTGAMIR